MTLIMAEVKRRLNATHLRRRLAEWRVVDMAEVRRREMIGCGICTHSPLARHYCEQRMQRPVGIWALEEPNQNEGVSISNAFMNSEPLNSYLLQYHTPDPEALHG